MSAGLATAEMGVLSADDWYKNHYAILYKERPWDNAEQIGAMFDEHLHLHQSDGVVAMANGPQWIAEAIAGWKGDGWIITQYADIDCAEHGM
jgi:hypothetical protein